MSEGIVRAVPLFLDTQVWDSLGLNFHTPQLRLLSQFVAEGRFRLVSTSVTQREIMAHVREAGTAVGLALNQLRKRLRPFYAEHVALVDEVETARQEDWENILAEQFERAFADLRLEVIGCGSVGVEEVLDRYFDTRPPFSEGRKRHEFPDAIAAEALEQWAAANDCEVCVVSGDCDWEQRCQESEHLRFFRTLEGALDFFTDENVSRALSVALKQHESEIQYALFADFGTHGTSLVDLEGDIEDPHGTYFEIVDAHIARIDGNQFIALLDCNIEAEAQARYDDPGSFIYDSEDHYVYHDIKHRIATASFSETVEVQGTFSLSDPSEIQIESVTSTNPDVDFQVQNP